MVEKKVIEACLKKDQRAYRTCYNQALPYVLSIVKRYIFNSNDHKDVVQEVFAQIFMSLHKYDSRKGDLKPFIKTISVRMCLNHLRKKKTLPIVDSLSSIHGDLASNTDDHKINELTQEEVERLLVNMPDGYRTILILHVLDGYSHVEIAEMLKITPETSRSQFYRGKKWILKALSTNKKTFSHAVLL